MSKGTPGLVLTDLMPADPLMRLAWCDCLMWAIGEEAIVATFRAETCNKWTPARGGLDKLIDAATGADVNFIRQFAQWFNENVWGPDA